MTKQPSFRKRILAAVLSLSLFAFPISLYSFDTDGISEFRSLDGSGNNEAETDLGTTDSILIRMTFTAYGDVTNSPRGVFDEDEGDGNVELDEQTFLPSPRRISNLVHDQNGVDMRSLRNFSQLFFQFGQFLSHDTGLSEPDSSVETGGTTGLVGNESFNVDTSNDPDFNFSELSVTRSVAEDSTHSGTGFREQINTITAFIDGSNVYGSTDARANALRSFVRGELLEQNGPDGALLPFNTFGLSNASAFPVDPTTLFAAGDVRANEQIGLTAFHTLFLREHNRIAREIYNRDFFGQNPSDTAVDEAIYQETRAIVAALLQKITYYEWLPALLGFDAMGPYEGYDPFTDPQIANEFSTAAFRLGHTMLPSTYFPTDANGITEEVALLNAFFNPSYVSTKGIDSIIRGQAGQLQQEIDRFIVDDVRNFLFGPGFGGLDLASLNIQRGRDHGVPSFKDVKDAIGLGEVSAFTDIASAPIAALLEQAYGSSRAEDVDLWTGGLCETHPPGTSLGPTFSAIFIDQFNRLRHGDRFYFENPDIYSQTFTSQIMATTFADIIRRNTSIKDHEVNDFAFFVSGYEPFQPDLTIAPKNNSSHYRGDNVYNESSVGQYVRLSSSKQKWARVFTGLQNDGAFVAEEKLVVQTPSKRKFRLKVFSFTGGGKRNITGSIRSGYYITAKLDPGQFERFETRVKVKPANRSAAPKATIHYRASGEKGVRALDSASARFRFRG
ncbi:MAG: peroxidase family protein [Verrucomicrobiota bacterium]